MEEELNDKVYGKYLILDAKTGEEKKGRYFVLKLDAKDEDEAKCVKYALTKYAVMQKGYGRNEYGESVLRYIGADEKNEEVKA